jgi:RimJ/RimL family protein N-acetyltransferase
MVRGVIAVPDPPLSDGVVTLRPAYARDLPSIEVGIRDPDVVRWLGRNDAPASEILALNERRWAEGSPTLVICEADRALRGLVWVNAGAKDPSFGYIGYFLLPEARGRGLATRAVRLISRWAIDDLGFVRLRRLTEPANERSQRVALRAGFREVEFLHGHGEIDGRVVDHLAFELPREGLL